VIAKSLTIVGNYSLEMNDEHAYTCTAESRSAIWKREQLPPPDPALENENECNLCRRFLERVTLV